MSTKFRTVKNKRTGDNQSIPILHASNPATVVTREKQSPQYAQLEQLERINELVKTNISSTAFTDVQVRPTKGFDGFTTYPPYTLNAEYTVVIPAYDEWNVLPDGLDKWKVYSGASWHEGLHARHSPVPLFKLQPTMPGVPPLMMRNLLNLVEDERIEDYGVIIHPGMVGKRELLRSYLVSGQAPIDKTPACQADLKAQMFTAFFQRFRCGKVIGSMSDPQMRIWVEEAAVYAKAEIQEINKLDAKRDGDEVTHRMDELVKKVAKTLHLNEDQNQPSSQGSQGGQQGQQGQQGGQQGQGDGKGKGQDKPKSLGDVKKKKEESKQSEEKPTDPNEVAREKLKDDDFREKVSEMNDAAKAGDNGKADKLKKEIMDDVKKEIEKNAKENAEKSESKEKLKDKIKDKLKDKGVKGSDEDLDDLADKLADQKAEDVDPGDDDEDASGGEDAKKGSEKGGKKGGKKGNQNGEKGDKKGDLDEAAEGAVDDFLDSPAAQDDHETSNWDKETIDDQSKQIRNNDGAIDPDAPFKANDKGEKSREWTKKKMDKDLQGKMKQAKAEGREKREDGDNSPEPTAEDIGNALNGRPEEKSQLEEIAHASEKAETQGVSSFAPIITPISATGFIDNGFKSKMRKKMQDWMVGKKVEYHESGARFDPRAHILSRDKKNFKVIRRKSVKGQKYLFIVDFSGSMGDRSQDYKKALINTFETIDSIGGSIAVVGFGGIPTVEDENSGQFRVKTFEEGRWKKRCNGKLAAITPSSTTPMAPCYQSIKNYVGRHKPNFVITVTDGMPDDFQNNGSMPNTIQALGDLKRISRSSRFVAFGLPNPSAEAQYRAGAEKYVARGDKEMADYQNILADLNTPEGMKKNFKKIGYHDNFATQDIKKLPDLIVDLITPK